MRCPSCQYENPDTARFCLNCGARLAYVCPQCGTELPPQARFCLACGAPLDSAQPTPASFGPDALAERLQRLVPKEYAERLLATRGKVQPERRVVTILFSDIKGSTSMAGQLDPEDWGEVMNGAFDFLIAPIFRYEGTLVQLLGDAILAFFGAPIAHEDDPERACRAALEIIRGIQEYAQKLERERGIEGFNVRVGINTGPVVVGEVGSDLRVAYTAMGDAINLAARMEQNAEPGTVLITEATHKLIAPLFETQAMAPLQVKGKAEPVSTYRVLAAKAVAGKVRGIAGLESPLVGREAELAALHEALKRLQGGVGGIVTIVGEAGVGKSRLVAELRKQAGGSDLQWVEGRCLSYGASIAYLLWLDVLRGLLGVKAEASPISVREALQEQVRALSKERFDDVYPYLAQLMSLPLESKHEGALRGLEAHELKAGTFQAVERCIECTAIERPLVLVCEDLHWADPTSIELLERHLAVTERAPLLLVNIFRPDKEHGAWQLRETAAESYSGRHTDLRLEPLSSSDSAVLLDNLIGIGGLPDALTERILSCAEGNPLYVEEVIRSLIDNGGIVLDSGGGRWQATQDVAEITIPDTLQGVLMARIDRLQEDAKRVLQMASVIGRIFLYRVLEAITAEEQELDQQLLTLQWQEMIRERARIPELEYIFKHELTREAAYSSLLKKQRRIFHRQVAETLEQIFPDRIEEQVGLLAHHWERAGEPQKAIHYLLQAGQRATRVSANQEAIAHLTKGLELLQTLPDTSQRAQQEFVLQLALGAPLIATKGWGTPEVGRACRRARELCQQVGDAPQLPSLLNLLYQFYLIRAEHQAALELAQEILAVAQRGQDPLRIAFPLGSMGVSSFYLGDFASARARLEQMIAFYNPEEHRSLAFVIGQDPAVLHLSYQAWTLWFLGYPDQALKRSHEAIALAQGLDHPFSLALAFCMAGWMHMSRREARATRERAEAAIRIAAPKGFFVFQSGGIGLRGWVQVEEGAIEEGIAEIRQGLAGWRATGTEFHRPHFLTWLAEAYAKAGQVQEGLAQLAEALELVEKTGERYHRAEIHRLKADLLWMQGNGVEAEAHYWAAIQVARQQSAKSLELRTTMRLSRLLQARGKQEQARQLLSDIYGWFTEGFDTPDLKDARALLDELS